MGICEFSSGSNYSQNRLPVNSRIDHWIELMIKLYECPSWADSKGTLSDFIQCFILWANWQSVLG